MAYPSGRTRSEAQTEAHLSDPLLCPLIIGGAYEDTAAHMAVDAPRDGRHLGDTATADASAVDRAKSAEHDRFELFTPDALGSVGLSTLARKILGLLSKG